MGRDDGAEGFRVGRRLCCWWTSVERKMQSLLCGTDCAISASAVSSHIRPPCFFSGSEGAALIAVRQPF